MSKADDAVHISTDIDTKQYQEGLQKMERSFDDFADSLISKVATIAAGFQGISWGKTLLILVLSTIRL